MNPKLILLRGLFRGKYHWGEFPDRLGKELQQYQIECLDIPGTGDLNQLSSPSTIEELVEALRQQLSSEEPITLLSISMGGMIAIKWAELYPNEVKRIIAINTSSSSLSPFYHRLLPQNYIKIILALFSTPVKRESTIFNMASNSPFNEKCVHYWVHLNEVNKVSRSNFIRQLRAASSFTVAQPNVPITLLSSKMDRLVSHQCSADIAKAWHCENIIHPCAGHDIPLDDPQWVCDQVKKVLALRQ